MYVHEILSESWQSMANLRKKKDKLLDFMVLSVNKSLSDAKIWQSIKHKLPPQSRELQLKTDAEQSSNDKGGQKPLLAVEHIKTIIDNET